MLAVTVLDLVRGLEARAAPVEVELKPLGEGEPLPISQLLTLFIVIFVLLVTCIFVPAFMLVDEREHRTLQALLVTPTTMSEVLLSKLLLGLMMAMTMAWLTLAFNDALGSEPLGLLATLTVAAIMLVEVGLIYGVTAKDAKGLYTLTKSLNLILIGPVIFYLFPDWPQWIAKLFPTYWIIDPLYQLGMNGASFADVWPELMVALGFCVLLLFPIIGLGRRLQRKLAAS